MAAGKVITKFAVDLSQLEQGAARAKQIVKDTSTDMAKSAKVAFTATSNTAIAGSSDLGASAALGQREKNITGALDDLTKKQARQTERDTIHNAAVARYQQSTGLTFRDKAQTQFERDYARQKRDEAKPNSIANALAGSIGQGRVGSFVSGIAEASGADVATVAKIGALATAIVYLGKVSLDAAVSVQKANLQYQTTTVPLIAASRQFVASGLDTAGLQAQETVAAKQRNLDIVDNGWGSKFNFSRSVYRHFAGLPDAHEQAQLELDQAKREAPLVEAAIQGQNELRVRNAAVEGGVNRSPIAVLRARQREERKGPAMALALAPGNATFLDWRDRMGATQADEMSLAQDQYGAHIYGMKTNVALEGLQGQRLQAQFSGNSRQMVAVDYAAKVLADKAEFREKLFNATPEEKEQLTKQYELRNTNRTLELKDSLRQLTENPGEAMSVRASEAAGRYGGVDRIAESMASIETMLGKLIQNAGLN